jgi:hypothetical protein
MPVRKTLDALLLRPVGEPRVRRRRTLPFGVLVALIGALIVVPPAAATYNGAILADGPAGYWRLDDTSPSSPAADSTSNGLDGTYSGDVTVAQPGALAGSFDLSVAVAPGSSGSSDGSIVVPSSIGGMLDPGTGDFSIEAWVQTSVTAPGQVIAAEATSGTDGCLASPSWVISLTTSGLVEFEMDTGPAGPSGVSCYSAGQFVAFSSSDVVVNDGAWHYVVVTVCQSCGGAVQIWVDGGSGLAALGLPAGSLSSGDPLQLGGSIAGSVQYQALNGSLDEIAYYAYALSDSEVANHYKAASTTGSGTGGDPGCPGCAPRFAPAAPHTSTSAYVGTTSTTTAYNQGCSEGSLDAHTPSQNSELVLDFGGQNSSNTGTIFTSNNGTGATYAQVAAYAEQYGKGYYDCARAASDTKSIVTVGLGTNNSAYQVSSAGGQAWAKNTVAVAKAWIISHGYSGQVRIWGADDMEPGYKDATSTRAWVGGYDGAKVAPYFDYGSSDACSTTSYQNATCAAKYTWHQADEYYFAWANPWAYVFPEIYRDATCSLSGVQAKQWTLISRYGYYYGGVYSKIIFEGPMTESPAGCTPAQAWSVLWNELNSDKTLPLGPAGLQSTGENFIFHTNI